MCIYDELHLFALRMLLCTLHWFFYLCSLKWAFLPACNFANDYCVNTSAHLSYFYSSNPQLNISILIYTFISTVRSFVITGIARTLTTIDQMITGLASFGALDYIRSHKNVMKPLFTLDGARHFQPTPELFIEGLNVLFSEEGSNRKASEIDVFKNFCDFVQDLGTTQGKNSRVLFIIILLLYIRHRLDMKNVIGRKHSINFQ